MTDLFGRTIEQLRVDLARKRRIFKITASFSGNEEYGKKVTRARMAVEQDERQLALLEHGIDPKSLGVYYENPDAVPNKGHRPPLGGQALARLQSEMLRGRR